MGRRDADLQPIPEWLLLGRKWLYGRIAGSGRPPTRSTRSCPSSS